MKLIKSYIAILLLGIFIFPATFQTIHVIWHNMDRCDATVYDKNHTKKEKIAFISPSSHCAVCEYQFAPNGIPDIAIYQPAAQLFNISFILWQEDPALQTVLLQKSPRAPPVFIS